MVANPTAYVRDDDYNTRRKRTRAWSYSTTALILTTSRHHYPTRMKHFHFPKVFVPT